MTEEQLIQSSQQGATNSFAELVALYQPRLLSFLLAHCQNREDAEDAIQEAFINAFRHIGSYNPKWKFSTWLFTIARRAAIPRKMTPHFESLEEGFERGAELVAKDSPNITEDSNIWLLIRPYLTQESFHLLWFFYAEELSLKDIAKIFDKNVSWVKVNLHRAREKLSKISSVQQSLEELVEEDET